MALSCSTALELPLCSSKYFNKLVYSLPLGDILNIDQTAMPLTMFNFLKLATTLSHLLRRVPFGLDNFERVSEEMFEKLEAEQNDCHSDRLLGVCIRCRLPVSAQTIDPLKCRSQLHMS